MTYAELKAAVLADAHRPDLTAEVARFIREAEGMLRRDLRAYVQSATLDESDRVSGGVYTLPSGLLELRAVYRADDDGTALEQVSLHTIRTRHTAAIACQYAMRGDTIEIRGTPGTDDEFEIEYLGHPTALSADADTNSILTNHEAIYVNGALFALYRHTQDLELAQSALDVFTDAVNKLNEATGRKLGGASIAGAYNLFGSGSGY